jgi:hypothetical protein
MLKEHCYLIKKQKKKNTQEKEESLKIENLIKQKLANYTYSFIYSFTYSFSM